MAAVIVVGVAIGVAIVWLVLMGIAIASAVIVAVSGMAGAQTQKSRRAETKDGGAAEGGAVFVFCRFFIVGSSFL